MKNKYRGVARRKKNIYTQLGMQSRDGGGGGEIGRVTTTAKEHNRNSKLDFKTVLCVAFFYTCSVKSVP